MIYVALFFVWLMGVACGVALSWLLGCSYCAAHPPTPGADHHRDTRAFGVGFRATGAKEAKAAK